jgi:hypothetical protein
MVVIGAQQAFSRGGARVSNAPIPDLPALAPERGGSTQARRSVTPAGGKQAPRARRAHACLRAGRPCTHVTDPVTDEVIPFPYMPRVAGLAAFLDGREDRVSPGHQGRAAGRDLRWPMAESRSAAAVTVVGGVAHHVRIGTKALLDVRSAANLPQAHPRRAET